MLVTDDLVIIFVYIIIDSYKYYSIYIYTQDIIQIPFYHILWEFHIPKDS